MFAELDQPAWAQLEGASGTAEELPRLFERLQTQLAEEDRPGCAELVDRVFDEVWAAGEIFPAAAGAVPFFWKILESRAQWLHPRILLMLGVLFEGTSGSVDSAMKVQTQIASKLNLYLSLAAAARNSEPDKLALIFLLAHFPAGGTGIKVAFDQLVLSPDDRARVDRCLTVPDFSDDGTLALIGHSWPTPAIWNLTAEEGAVDRSWRQAVNLEVAEAAEVWDLETKAILAYLGAQAEHAICSSA